MEGVFQVLPALPRLWARCRTPIVSLVILNVFIPLSYPLSAPNTSLSRYANQPMKKYSNTVVSRAYLQCLVIWIIVLQCNSTLATFTFFVISVLQCFPALFHCFANHVLQNLGNTSFTRFQKYKFLCLFHKVLQSFTNESFARFCKYKFCLCDCHRKYYKPQTYSNHI